MSSLRTIVKAKIHAFNYFHKQTVILYLLIFKFNKLPYTKSKKYITFVSVH